MAYTYRHGDRPLAGLTIQRAVGRGGFGEVYYAITDAGKEIAVKYIRENPEIELRGVREVMNLSSPHLLQIYDIQRSPAGEPFVLMEYVSGPSLRDVIRFESGGLSVEKAVFFARGIAQGLGYLHDHGVVHRDLKPGNIFYDDGYVKIGDYGLSKHMSLSQHSGQTVSIGTVHYMAPEIGSGRYTKLVDIYALGVILYEMLVGRPPFVGSSIQEVLVRQLRDDADTSLLPRGFAPIVSRALEKDAKDRYQDVYEMADALTRLADVPGRLSRFDPLTLTRVPRASESADPDPTHTSPGPAAVATLDARSMPADERRHRPYEIEPPYQDRYRRPGPRAFAMPLGIKAMLDVFGVLFALGAAAVAGSRGGEPFVQLQKLMFVVSAIPGSVLLYRWWATLPAGWRRTTPGRAVGFCFIPLFNLYWFWVALHGLVIDLNRYRKRFAPDVNRMSHGWLVAFWILFVASMGAGDELAESRRGAGGLGAFYLLALAAWTTVDVILMIKFTVLCQNLLERDSAAGVENRAAVAAYR